MKNQQTDNKKNLSYEDRKIEKAFAGLFECEDENEPDSEVDSVEYQSLNRHCPDNKIYPRPRKLF